MIREKTVTTYTCDCCGAEIDDKTTLFITAHVGDEVWFEWWACGDYCADCAQLLAESITSKIPVPERYDRGFQDKEERVRHEVEMIREVDDRG